MRSSLPWRNSWFNKSAFRPSRDYFCPIIAKPAASRDDASRPHDLTQRGGRARSRAPPLRCRRASVACLKARGHFWQLRGADWALAYIWRTTTSAGRNQGIWNNGCAHWAGAAIINHLMIIWNSNLHTVLMGACTHCACTSMYECMLMSHTIAVYYAYLCS